MKGNTEHSWGIVSRGLHWLMAVLVGAQLTLGWIGHEMENSPAKITWMTGHKSLGLTLLVLLLIRWLWRLSQPVPALPPGSTAFERLGARAAHWAFYLLLLGLAVSGWIIADTSRIPWEFWWTVPLPDIIGTDRTLHEVAEEAHETVVWCLVTLLTLHVLASAWHQWIRRDDLMRRMWRG
jgi:cytochrome b561